MPLYRFKVSDRAGKISEMIIEGESQKDATKRLRYRNVVILEFLGEGDSMETGRRNFWEGRGFDSVEFTERLVPLLDAGITLERSLQILAESSEKENEKRLLGDLRRGLHEGRKLSKLIRDRGRIFPPLYSSIVEAGEESGALPQVMGELRRFLTSTREMKNFLISSAIYPVIVLFVSVLTVIFLLGYIIPKFADVFKNSGKDIPALTQALLNVSEFVAGYWWLIIILIVGAIAGGIVASRNPVMKERWDNFLLKMPLIGKIVKLSNLSRLLRTMGVLINSGVHLLDSVAISSKVIQNETLKSSISFVSNDLRRGEKLSVSLSKSEYIPPMVIRMLGVGEETGDPAGMMERIAVRYEEDVRKMLKTLISLFEPAMILTLAVVVGGIMVVLFMSIMSMQG